MSETSAIIKESSKHHEQTSQSKQSPHPHQFQMGHDTVEIDYEALPDNSPIIAQLTAGAFAGIMEHTVMYPIDALKTRMQASNHLSNEGLIQLFTKISSTEGAVALWRGVSSVVLGAGPAHAIYYLVFEATKTTLCNNLLAQNTNNTKNPNSVTTRPAFITDERHPFIASASGIAATITSDALMTPFDVLKQRMQIITEATAPKSTPPTMTKTFLNIYRKEGIRPFFISYPTTLILNIPFAAINFGVYEYTSSKMNPEQIYNPLLHCVAGGISGAAAAAVTTPLDCIKTVLQTKSIKNVNGFMSAAKGLYEVGGSRAFLRGLKPRVIFNMPSTAISWTAYEMAKAYLLKE
ncbi:hypothetical protein CANARDRAFT_9095 [[Candida] arabinofermentans NRRL YB-2248]|uniref:Mitochondrial carrier protein n=1 Tax=[Candida] arabinofermentans NRRL YB-2248 TaxID=983967 RepID=A0A1E4SX92_9ASCO|nr:hypothetical protein CANARDRAFT_9095 [[Candida] arabinofermentans NRRL YB-2248]